MSPSEPYMMGRLWVVLSGSFWCQSGVQTQSQGVPVSSSGLSVTANEAVEHRQEPLTLAGQRGRDCYLPYETLPQTSGCGLSTPISPRASSGT